MKILLLDIETAPMKAWVWGVWGQDIATNQIEEPGYTMCWAAKWYKKREVMFDSIYESSTKKMLKGVHRLVDEADAIVHYNGTKFDMPSLNTGWLEHGFRPPTFYANIDLLPVARRKFRFPHNKLDYVAQELGVGKKVQHKGMDLWKGCMAGDEDDWAVMKRYNIQDVRLLERVYVKMLPWIERHPNYGLFVKDQSRPICPNCGSRHLIRNGVRTTRVSVYHRYICKDCGASSRGRYKVRKDDAGVLT